jgi:nicotinic acetylcholine receptor
MLKLFAFKVDLRHQEEEQGTNVVNIGVDLSEFYMSVEWDILAVPAIRNVKFYTWLNIFKTLFVCHQVIN